MVPRESPEPALSQDGLPQVDRKFRKELCSGVTALALLGIMNRALEPLYGYSIARLTDAEGTGASLIKHGALYPVLRSLEASGLLESSVEPSVSGPPRKYYEITGEGRAALERWSGIWSDTVAFVNGLIEGVGNDQPGH